MFLASMESRAFADIRGIDVERVLRFPSGKKCLLVKLTPPGPGADFGLPGLLEAVVLSPRLEGYSIDPINEYPCYVHIAALRQELNLATDVISRDALIDLAWGEVYEDAEQAKRYLDR